jgi:hypothetical protein
MSKLMAATADRRHRHSGRSNRYLGFQRLQPATHWGRHEPGAVCVDVLLAPADVAQRQEDYLTLWT